MNHGLSTKNMARFTRLQTYAKMAETGLVPVFYHSNIEVCQQVLAASYRAGVRVFEFTNRGDFAHEIFGELNKFAAQHCPEMIMGAGTIFDTGTAALYMQLGACFIVSPVLKEDVAITCNRRKVGWIPGCATMGEVSRAEELGAEVVKIFPGDVVGPAFVKSLLAPMPWSTVMVTGGVKPEADNLKSWFQAGVTCVGLGSQLVPTELLNSQDYAGIENHMKTTMDLVKQARNKK
ncbi:bifunctional 4-hydroxy-2-oxoglutarate aldolase/2-dehydro-3-deoxy-phosphogluconate aldolase [Adhaeribacter radiodurans]|nr:bifunctional 4-hydroxy-2-oxoglutarate aldolase/2-dehydro-3-deoxy-phosphogluconate aldolase [Adhaeribacter radiodurans]